MIKLKKAFLLISMLIPIFNLFSQIPEYVWANQGGHASLIEGNMQIQNTTSGMISAGDFYETALFDEEEIISNGTSDIFISSFNELGELQQIYSFGSENEEFLKFMKVDSDGNIILSIMFTDFISIGDEEFISYGGQDVLIIKLNSSFSIQWVKHFGTSLTDYIRGMEVDNEGNILVFGKFKNTIDFDAISLTSVGSTDLYIAKFNPDGEVEFAFNEGGEGFEDANSIAVSADGAFYISGTFYDETIVNGENIFTDNATGIFIAKYNSASEFQWVEIIEGEKLSPFCHMTATPSGDVYIAGSFEKNLIFGNQTLTTEEFEPDVYVGKYNSDGESLWGGQGDSNSSETISAIDCDETGNIYLSGKYLSQIDFNGVILNYTLC